MQPSWSDEVYICVDVETSGPIPGDYSILSIGACTVYEPVSKFYIELKPINQNNTPEAANVHKLSFDRLMDEGLEPEEALRRFEDWLFPLTIPSQLPVFVAFNAPFDWMFVNYYFLHYLGRNPFGHAALDIKALYMGVAEVPWLQTAWRYIDPSFSEMQPLSHHALQDALDQAAIFRRIMEKMNQL